MAYAADIVTDLSPDHYFTFDGVDTDSGVGPNAPANADLLVSGAALTGAAITRGSTNSMAMTALTDTREMPDSAEINASTLAYKLISLWVAITTEEVLLHSIWKEGGGLNNIACITTPGNNIVFQAQSSTASPAISLQLHSGLRLLTDRPYHVALHLEGDSLGSIARLYIDGIEVSSGSILDDFPSHTADITWGQTDTNLLVGGSQQSFDATLCLQSDYAFWGNSTVQVTATQIREELFEKGALPDITIAADTTANMQIALDAIASTVRPNWPLAILIKQSTDETNFGLDADNITFNSLASIHVDYDGPNTFTWTNTNGSDATQALSTATGGGTIVISNPLTVAVSVTVQDSAGSPIENARVYLKAGTGGPLAVDTVILSGLTNASGVIQDASFAYSADQPVVGTARKSTSTPFYKAGFIGGTITTSGLSSSIFLILDE